MKIVVERDAVKKAIYFISLLTQMQQNRPMQGALSSKGDYMGGIFDRWINIIPESIVFNEDILIDIVAGKTVEVITDFYDYNPKVVGIAPDVIGIRVEGNPIPFVHFDDHWKQIYERPQIEVKTFKQSQKMVSLRNQGYDDKYLVLVLSDFDVDYLIPLMDHSLLEESVYEELHMNDDVFIISNSACAISQPHMIDLSKTSIGTVELMKITKSSDFMAVCNCCPPSVCPEYFVKIEKVATEQPLNNISPLLSYVDRVDSDLYRFNSNWYQVENNKGRKLRDYNTTRTLDIAVENIENIHVLSIYNYGLKVLCTADCSICGESLFEGNQYKVMFGKLNRGGSTGSEYFLNKTSINYLKDYKQELKRKIKTIIEESGY